MEKPASRFGVSGDIVVVSDGCGCTTLSVNDHREERWLDVLVSTSDTDSVDVDDAQWTRRSETDPFAARKVDHLKT